MQTTTHPHAHTHARTATHPRAVRPHHTARQSKPRAGTHVLFTSESRAFVHREASYEPQSAFARLARTSCIRSAEVYSIANKHEHTHTHADRRKPPAFKLPPRAWHVHAESVTPHSNECVPQERETIPRMLVRTQRLPLTSCVPKSGTGRTCTRSLKLRAAHRPRRTRRSTYPLRSQRARGQRCARRSSRNAAAGLTGCVSRVPHTGRMCTGVT